MALKKRRTTKLSDGIKSVAEGVQSTTAEDNPNRQKRRTAVDKPLPVDTPSTKRKAQDYTTIVLTGSKGQTYRVAIPASYQATVPKVWEWTAERYKVAELIADGMPIAQIPNHPEVNLKSRITIYGWLEHPEFKEHVDALVLETGWASRRERLNNLNHLNRVLLNKIANEIDSIKLTDKSLGAVLSALQAGAKLIAQEKGEFVEETKVTQDTNISGTLGTAQLDITQYMKDKSDEEKRALEKEFDSMGDDIIRQLTGTKE